jgi:arabinofuranan 3-O-arabinosyltransferase
VWVDSAAGRLPLRPRGTVAALDDGLPLQAASCGGRLKLPEGRQNLSTGGGLFAIEHLMLESPSNEQRATSNAGRVLDLGDAGRSSYDGVRVALDGPAWLVLGEAYNRGWRAWCDDRSLGEPEPIDGYANGWQAPADCRDVRFDFAPQRFVTAGYIGSGACLLIAVLLLLLTRPRAPRWHVGAELARHPSTRRFGPLPAALIALAAAGVVAGLFGLRAGAVAAPVLALLLWGGAGVPLLLAAAGVLLAVIVPLLYLLFPVENRNGFNPAYAAENVEVHWVVVGAWVLLAVSLWRILSTASRRSAGAGRSGA